MASKFTKQAFFGEIFKKINDNPTASTALYGAAASAGLAGITAAVTRLKDTVDRSRSFRETMELYPGLKKQDQGKVKRYFNTLSTFSPTMSKDPTVAGAWIKNITDNESSFDEGAGGQALLRSVHELAGVRQAFEPRPSELGATIAKQVKTFGENYSNNVYKAQHKEHAANMTEERRMRKEEVGAAHQSSKDMQRIYEQKIWDLKHPTRR